jgi:hypothetical protein
MRHGMTRVSPTLTVTLSPTSDALLSLDAEPLPRRARLAPTETARARAAGSKIGGGEGFVRGNRGVHGGADLKPNVHDWHNRLAEASVRLVR